MLTTNSTDGSVAALEQLSALADGELDEAGIGKACQDWRGDARLRSSWHAYHLIGDVLRSDDLAGDPRRDARLLAALRSRLAEEPVVLAPAPLPRLTAAGSAAASSQAAGRRRRSWMMSSAVAAGFVAVAGVVFVTRAPEVQSTLASGAAALPAPVSVVGLDGFQPASARNNPPSRAEVTAAAPPDPQALVASGKLIRDVRLDRYLSAHKEFAGSSALGVPSGYLRNATADASDR